MSIGDMGNIWNSFLLPIRLRRYSTLKNCQGLPTSQLYLASLLVFEDSGVAATSCCCYSCCCYFCSMFTELVDGFPRVQKGEKEKNTFRVNLEHTAQAAAFSKKRKKKRIGRVKRRPKTKIPEGAMRVSCSLARSLHYYNKCTRICTHESKISFFYCSIFFFRFGSIL